MAPVAGAQKRILLGQLAARGDCLYATAVARQIKADFPGCHLTWAIGSMCREILDGNPDVDAVWEVPLKNHAGVVAAWLQFEQAAGERRRNGEFDEVFFTQIYPANFKNYDYTVRASIFRGYPRAVTVPVAPVVNLRADEIENVRRFAELHGLTKNSATILFEFASGSGQTFVDFEFAAAAAARIIARLPECKIVMTSQLSLDSTDPRVISGHTLSFRENAELTRYCSLLIGCSSGITWLCTSSAAKPLPTIQLLKKAKGAYASVVHDHEYFGLPTEHIIEMTECPVDHLVDCVVAGLRDGFARAKPRFHVRLQPDFRSYTPMALPLINAGAYGDVLQSNWHILRRYGPRPAVLALHFHTLVNIGRQLIANAGGRIAAWFNPSNRDGKH